MIKKSLECALSKLISSKQNVGVIKLLYIKSELAEFFHTLSQIKRKEKKDDLNFLGGHDQNCINNFFGWIWSKMGSVNPPMRYPFKYGAHCN